MTRPHLLLLAEDFAPPDRAAGGVRICVHEHVRRLSRAWRVTVLAPVQVMPPLPRYAAERRAARERAAGPGAAPGWPGVRVLRPRYLHVPLVSFLTEPLQLLGIGLWVALRHARDVRVVHGHRLVPMGLAAVLLGRVLGRPSVVTVHGSELSPEVLRRNARFGMQCRFALRRADRVMVVSRGLYGQARALGADEARLVHLANGVDPEALAAGDADAGRRLAGFDRERPLIVSIGGLVPIKGHGVLLEAFRILRGRRPGVALALAGDGPARPALEEQVRAAGLGADVHLLGAVPHSRVPDLLAAARLAALPSLGEGMPLAALEALAAGRPLVGSDVGGVGEVIEQGRDGLLVSPGDPGALAQALEKALDCAWDAGALSRRVRERSFDWESVVARQERVYAALAGLPPAGAGLAR